MHDGDEPNAAKALRVLAERPIQLFLSAGSGGRLRCWSEDPRFAVGVDPRNVAAGVRDKVVSVTGCTLPEGTLVDLADKAEKVGGDGRTLRLWTRLVPPALGVSPDAVPDALRPTYDMTPEEAFGAGMAYALGATDTTTARSADATGSPPGP